MLDHNELPVPVTHHGDLLGHGWQIFPADADSRAWRDSAAPYVPKLLADPEMRRIWLQCQETWFVGVDVLPNDASGALPNGGPLSGAAMDMLAHIYGPIPPLHKAQLSVVFPGYPKPRNNESDSAFSYRLRRFGAHIDGLLPIGSEKRRHLCEPHAYIVGIALDGADEHAAPLVIWDGSHNIIREHLAAPVTAQRLTDLSAVDLTEQYHRARRAVFESCSCRKVVLQPGEIIVLHRFCLHGIAPWFIDSQTTKDQRAIAYFRPCFQKDPKRWLDQP